MEPSWQKNFRRTPDSIAKKAERIEGEKIIVAAVKKITAGELQGGLYGHLEMSFDGTAPQFPPRIMPPPMNGKFSLWNAQGKEVIRRDLPMITKTFSIEAPNYGDWSNGSHEISWDREVYQREFVPPGEAELSITLLRTEPGDNLTFVFLFRVEQVLDKNGAYFADDLFATVNLLQENAGAVDVFASEADAAEYLKTISVQWEILPPGERTETLNRVLSKFRNPSDDLKKKLTARYTLLEKLKPVAYISGTSGFQRYFGAQLKNDLVIFENLEYGNAIYIMFEDWEKLSKLSRTELLRNRRQGFERIVHRDGWEETLVTFVRGRLAA